MKKISNESGIAMPLAMVMVMLIGVMGAGVLVFATSDLDSVIEVNRGQQAIEMAEVGLKAAKVQLMEYPDPRSYDPNLASAPFKSWAMCKTGVTPTECNSIVNQAAGKTLTLDGRTATVKIRKSPISTSSQAYFEVTSEASISGSRRKIQAIYRTSGWGIKSYYTPGSIYIGKDDASGESLAGKLLDRVDIRGVSLFAGRDVIIEDNYNMRYRQIGRSNTSSNYRYDSVIGGGYQGLSTGSSRYCIDEGDFFRNSYSNSNCTALFNAFQAERTYDYDWLYEASAWENANLPQPHIRIVANTQCPELYYQWVSGSGSGKPYAVDPDYHEDALGDWAVPPFNTVGRAVDPTQTNTNTSITASNPAPCQDGSDSDLEPYPAIGSSIDRDGTASTPPEIVKSYIPAGIGAEGRICRGSDYAADSDCDTSIATLRVGDIRGGAGRIGYDSTTTPRFRDNYDVCSPASTDGSCATQSGYISYPFNYKDRPDINGLLQIAKDQPSTTATGSTIRSSRYVNLDTASSNYLDLRYSSNWDKLYPDDNRVPETVVFIDANGKDLELPNDDNPKQGILVVRCGNLTNMDNFKGIIITLKDTYSGSPASSTCDKKGNYRTGRPGMTETIDIDGYVYAEGVGDPASADNGDPTISSDNDSDSLPDYRFGISIHDGSNVDRLGKNYLGLQNIVGNGLQGVVLDSWRECYNAACN